MFKNSYFLKNAHDITDDNLKEDRKHFIEHSNYTNLIISIIVCLTVTILMLVARIKSMMLILIMFNFVNIRFFLECLKWLSLLLET